jgi:UDPglucose 6-dehydrogenase
MKLTVIGTGYVGLVTGACFAKLGHTVTCVDVDTTKVELINNGQTPIYEPGLEDLLQTYAHNLHATTDATTAIYQSDITFICVGTPSHKDGSIDLTYIQNSAAQIGKILRNLPGWHLIVIKSTVVPGTTDTTVRHLLETNSNKHANTDFGLAMNPEFLREGNAIHDFLTPDRIVIGVSDQKTADTLRHLYTGFTCPIIETSLSAAEMIKYASNAFLATKVSYINEIGNLCKTLNIDTYQVAEGMGYDHRIGRAFLDAGIGWGGSCFPKDIDALLAWVKDHHTTAPIITATRTVNQNQPLRLIPLLQKHVPKLKGKTIGLLGLAFKPQTDDIRESRAIPIATELLKHGAFIKAYDPQAMNNFKTLFPTIEYCTHPQEVLNSDAVLITTKWEEFSSLDFTGKIVIDGRRLDEAKKTARIYEGVCW